MYDFTTTERYGSYEFRKNGSATWVGDGHHSGTEIFWSQQANKWVAADLENKRVQFAEKLAAVTIEEDQNADDGLNQACIACDLDGEGLWIVPADWLDEVQPGYVNVIFREE